MNHTTKKWLNKLKICNMATISINNLARAIYESSLDKNDVELQTISRDIVNLISEKHLMNKSEDILDKLQILVDKNEDTVRAKISSKEKINEKTKNEIEEFIKKRYKAKNIILTFENNDKLLGGIKIQIKDEIIDMTLKSKINRLKNYLITN